MSNDYTPVPGYVAPTEGNMQQAATQIANWIRSKGYGKDTRESMAQAVQLFGDVAAQFINEASGLKGQFNSAIENVTSNTELQAARTSTVSGTGYTTLGERLDAIDNEQKAHDTKLSSGVVDTSSAQDVDGVKNFLQLPTFASGRSILPASDTGWLNSGVTMLNGCVNNSFYYRIITIGSFKLVCFKGAITLPASTSGGVLANGYADAGNILTLPSSATIDGIQNFEGKSFGGSMLCGIRVRSGVTFQVGDVATGVVKTDSQQIVFNDVLFGIDVVE
ncbi:MAG: hypothetical protein ABF536_06425 [Liquorilactobacillus mali]|uniref:hypothetical protein n=1 Tax=Liquorilactobacillus mali TaxID=1618 RepID=UPI0039E91A42